MAMASLSQGNQSTHFDLCVQIPSGVSRSTDNFGYHLQHFTTNTCSEMLKGVGLDGHLKLSVLAGLVDVGGSASYAKDLKSSARTVKAALKLEVKTRYESLVMERLFPDQHSLREEVVKEATHFVAGVQWGGNAYASVEKKSSTGTDARGIEARVSARLSEFGALLVQPVAPGLPAVNATSGTERGHLAVAEEETFEYRVDADVLPDSTENMISPNSFEEAMNCMSKIPAQLAHGTNQGRVRPVRFTLYPLSKLAIPMAPRCISFTSHAIEDLERIFNQLHSTKQDLHDLFEDMSMKHSAAFSSCDKAKVAAFRNDVEAAEGKFRAAVREQVVAIRSQKGEVAGFEKLLRDFSTPSQAVPSKAQAFMGPYKEKLKRITEFNEKGVQFVSKTSSSTGRLPIRCLLNAGPSIWEVILTYCEPCGPNNSQEWEKNWEIFSRLLEQSRCGQDLTAHNNEPSATCIHFLVQENQHGEGTRCKTAVSVHRDGSVVSEDTALLMSAGADTHPSEAHKNLAYSSVGREVIFHAPAARTPLQSYCPGHYVQLPSKMASCSRRVITDWACERCKGCVEDGKDGFLYCECGRVPLRACRFRCSSQIHGPLFVAFPADVDVEKILEMQAAARHQNILLLGETGVGKSTFINAFANYLRFESLDSAIDSAGDLTEVIPMAFTRMDPDTFERHEIKFGQSDDNENDREGESATQTCRSYTFHLPEHQTVQFIDTPGVGDTRGIEYDKANFVNVLSHLKLYAEIHGICIMLKPDETRVSERFRFCLKELLRHLHRSATENIVFLFTFSRGTLYTAGNTIRPLERLLNEIRDTPPHVRIELNPHTMYFVDNEALRYLAALRKGHAFSPEDKVFYSQSWTKSASVCRQMLDHIRFLPPHKVQDTVSLSLAQSWVSLLQNPLVDVAGVIQRNLTSLAALEKQLEESSGELMSTEVHEVEPVPLKKGARTVCSSFDKGCKWRKSSDGEIEVSSSCACHEPCSYSITDWVFSKEMALWFCKVMTVSGECRVCQCSYRHHVRLTYGTKLVARKLTFGNELQITELKQYNEECQRELDAITQACAQFAHFYRSNSIVRVNDGMEAYLNYKIHEEDSRPDGNTELIFRWKAFLEAYQKQIHDLERMATKSSTTVSGGTAEEIMQVVTSLLELKHMGPTIKKLVEEVRRCEDSPRISPGAGSVH